MSSVRERLIAHGPPSLSAHDEQDTLAQVLYLALYSLHDSELCVDGWLLFVPVAESDEALDAVGLMSLLPSGSAPVMLHVRASGDALEWTARCCVADPAWLVLSESKRWKQVYLLAHGDRADMAWAWDRQFGGRLPA